ncbi:sensor histidine kinase [Actomonas aquatica]|uniref:histidine kinase n=1 Tax=Actomonas aquatica TaxID=2866162 RepID=A0ABZ1C5K9_9BACT|nr:sensor histidine kinase [Opitutus sp. WL0086]WRQ86632.1 sensor histidine kinase [Opitutus sp. WL0086]
MQENRYTKWIALIAVWTVVGLILSTEVFFTVRVTRPEIAFWDVLASQYARVGLWALLTPVVWWLRRVVPLRMGNWFGGVGFHFSLSLLIMLGYYLARILFVMVREGESLAAFWNVAVGNFFGRNLIDLVFYWAIIGSGYTFEIYRKYKNEQIKAAQLESRLVRTELSSLKQQLHPHFLFNTMNTISVLVREERNTEAVSLLSKLSALLRISLDTSRVEEVTVRQEMEFLERYIDIQKMRFADRLSVDTDISSEALEARIPNLLLQPLVENAIIHGVAPKNGPGRVRVAGVVKDGRLHLEVADDGLGIDNAKNVRSREGIGLSNTRERLARLYGAHSQLVLKSEPGQGTTVSIVLPCRI